MRIGLSSPSLIAIFVLTSHPSEVLGWGQRGHAILTEAAAYALDSDHRGLKEISFSLGYYSNVPDVIWKADEHTRKIENAEHFMDLEVFERYTKSKPSTWPISRAEFEKKFPDVPQNAGRAFWRIHELSSELAAVTEKIKSSAQAGEKYQEQQKRWVLLAGIISHYVADLSQPLHLTENYDGQLSKQKGIHKVFEVDIVNELWPQTHGELFRRVASQWSAFHKRNQKKDLQGLLVELSQRSFLKKEELLEIDKLKGRDVKKVAGFYKALLLDRLTDGALFLAEIWSRHIGWKLNLDKFYYFESEPAYISPLKSSQ